MISEEHKKILDTGAELGQIIIKKIEEMADGDASKLFLLFQGFLGIISKYHVEIANSEIPLAENAVIKLRDQDKRLFEALLARKKNGQINDK